MCNDRNVNIHFQCLYFHLSINSPLEKENKNTLSHKLMWSKTQVRLEEKKSVVIIQFIRNRNVSEYKNKSRREIIVFSSLRYLFHLMHIIATAIALHPTCTWHIQMFFFFSFFSDNLCG